MRWSRNSGHETLERKRIYDFRIQSFAVCSRAGIGGQQDETRRRSALTLLSCLCLSTPGARL